MLGIMGVDIIIRFLPHAPMQSEEVVLQGEAAQVSDPALFDPYMPYVGYLSI